MRKLLVVALTMAMLLVSAGAAMAENSATASVSYMSRYVWRGLVLSESYAIQPSVDFVKDSFGVNMWSSYDGETSENVETDLTLNYTLPVEAVSVDVGWIYYALEGFNDTQELYLALGKELGPVEGSFTIYYDTEEGTGYYMVLTLDYGTDLSEKASLAIGASASYQMDNNIVGGVDADGKEYAALHSGEVYASASYAATDSISIEPIIAYTTLLSADAKDYAAPLSFDGKESMTYGGVTVSMGF